MLLSQLYHRISSESPVPTPSQTTNKAPQSASTTPKPVPVWTISTDPPVTMDQTTIPGKTHTVLVGGDPTGNISGSATPSATAAAQDTPFLQNKAASGIVFTLVAIAGLFLIGMIATFAIRRRRTKRLHDDAASFNPVKLDFDTESARSHGIGEKPRPSSSVGHGSTGGPELRQAPAFIDYVPAPVPREYVPPPGVDRASGYANPAYANHQPQRTYSPGPHGQPYQPRPLTTWEPQHHQRMSQGNLLYSTASRPQTPQLQVQPPLDYPGEISRSRSPSSADIQFSPVSGQALPNVHHAGEISRSRSPSSADIQYSPVSGQAPPSILSQYEPTKGTAQGLPLRPVFHNS